MSLSVGSVVEGVVTGITNFGAFVQLPSGETGLVHISEVADAYVENINDYLNKEDRVKVKILSIDEAGKKIGLSIRQAQEGYKPRARGGGRRRGSSMSLDDKLARFLKESDERQAAIRRGGDSRRGGRGARGF